MVFGPIGHLHVESLLQLANARTGAGFGDSYDFLHPLEVLIDSLECEARLSPTGRRITATALALSLETQLRAQRQLADEPGIAETPLDNPLFIIGLPRTGMTVLHHLLGLHPSVRAPALWELRNPVSARDSATVEGLIAECTWWEAEYYRLSPEMRPIHHFSALEPEECHLLTRHTYQSLLFLTGFRVPSYARWLAGRDLRPVYEYHRMMLQHILWRVPGERLVLRCPEHLWHLDALAAVYPDARLVHMHRDPAAVLGSVASLSVTARRQRSGDVDPRAVGREWHTEVGRALEELPEDRGLPALDVRFTDLQADPLGTLTEVCSFAGLSWTPEFERRVRVHLAEQPPRDHRYQLVDYGFDASELAVSWAAYRRRFGV